MEEHTNDIDVNNNDEDKVRTLFVSGLPTNVRSREIYLLFRAFKTILLVNVERFHRVKAILGKLSSPSKKGYEGFQLKLTDKQGKTSPVSFVSFMTREDAEQCKQNLQGVRFDPDVHQTLRIEFARTNTKVTPTKHHLSLPKSVEPHEALTPLDLTGFSFFASEPVWHHARIPTYGDSPTSPLPSPIHSPVVNHFPHNIQTPLYQPYNVPNVYSLRPATMMSNDICSTLFVANLGKSCTEADLITLFSRTHGFRKLKMLNKGSAPCCFAEYQDVYTAASAMNVLQGQILPSSEGVRGGIRIEYARSRMGEPRHPLTGEQVITSVPSSPQGPPINITAYS